MIRSLLIKLAMLAVTIGIVLWIGWRAPQAPAPVAVTQTEPTTDSVAIQVEPYRKPTGLANADSPSAKTNAQAKMPQRDLGGRRGPLDLNRASVADLESLPSLGPVLARRVVAYRQSVGKFQSVDELRQVKGIGRKHLDRVRPLLTVTSPTGGTKREEHL